MDNSLLVSLSSQLAAYRSMDVIANNLANASTPAFKCESVKFQEMIAQVTPSDTQHGPQDVTFVKDTGVTRDMTQGSMDVTNAPYDVAINGKGYMVIQTPQGDRYTRNGHFTLDPNGQLVTSDGEPVMGDGGAITITADDGDIHIASDGTVSGKDGDIGKLRLVDFPDDRALVAQGDSLYSTTQTPADATDATLTQGMLESSNVQPVLEISHMIEVMRAYQATAAMTASQESMKKDAIEKLGAMPN